MQGQAGSVASGGGRPCPLPPSPTSALAAACAHLRAGYGGNQQLRLFQTLELALQHRLFAQPAAASLLLHLLLLLRLLLRLLRLLPRPAARRLRAVWRRQQHRMLAVVGVGGRLRSLAVATPGERACSQAHKARGKMRGTIPTVGAFPSA